MRAQAGLSGPGVPDGVVRWLSMNVVAWLAAFAWGVVARRSGGGYRRLLPFAFSQALVFHGIAVLGILLTIAGRHEARAVAKLDELARLFDRFG